MESPEDVSIWLPRWFAGRSGLRVDIVGDFAGKELFAIDGDMLMAHCISQARVDYGDGFQLLHGVHSVEKFLADLEQRGCRFHLLWFSSHESLCVPAGEADKDRVKYELTRAVLIEHLGRGNTRADRSRMSFDFANMDSSEFSDYLASHAVQFFLVSDGRAASVHSAAQAQPQSQRRILQCLGIFYRLNTMGYSMALLDGIEISSSKVFATVFSPSPPSKALPDLGNKDAVECPKRAEPDLVLRGMLRRPSFSREIVTWDDGYKMSGRVALGIVAVSCMASSNQTLPASIRRHLAAFITHLVFLRHCPLSHRCSERPAVVDKKGTRALALFLRICTEVVQAWSTPDMAPLASLEWDLFDMVDGRAFLCILSKLDSIVLPSDLAFEAQQLADRVQRLSGVDCSRRLPKTGDVKDLVSMSRLRIADEDEPSVLPFGHPILDPFLRHVSLHAQPAVQPTPSSRIFEELSHWHNAKNLVDPKVVLKPGFFARRRNQKFMADMLRYSESLSSEPGRIIIPEMLIVASAPSEACSEPARGGAQQPPKADWRSELKAKTAAKKSKQPETGRDKAIQAASLARAEKTDAKKSRLVAAWVETLKRFEKEADLVRRHDAAARYEALLSEEGKEAIGANVSLYICNILAYIYQQPATKQRRADIAAMIWNRVIELKKEKTLSHECAAELELFSSALHLTTEHPSASSPSTRRGAFSYPSSQLNESQSSLVPAASLLDFQLESCGPYLDRGFDSAADARVRFQPDAWQREVLDAIDSDRSLFVVAPTSAGKTFISFYAMKKVMQASDDDVLVYVAPTKALVNQIAAEVQARFRKAFRHEGRSVWAIHSRDYRVNTPAGCQVLVTVPHILQIMLLAPGNAERPNSWSRRIKRIIFDEVHCIGQADDGIVWEQLLLMAPCPVIALSATVGNPDEFALWLEASQRAKGFGLETIIHSARYSDLRKYLYAPPTASAVDAHVDDFQGFQPRDGLPIPGLDGQGESKSPFSFVHPVASIVNRQRGNLDDISLESRDCLALWRALVKYQTNDFPADEQLSPSKALPAVIKKSDVVRWEAALKSHLSRWMADPDSPFAAVRDHFRSQIGNGKDAQDGGSFGFGVSSHFGLFLDLHRHAGLPALVFNYDRVECERILDSVMEQLEAAESNWKSKSKEWAKKMAAYGKWQSAQSTRKPRGGKVSSTPMSKEEQIREEAEAEASVWESFDPSAPLERFSFADTKKLQASELEELIRSLDWVQMDQRFVRGLRRGLGVHHAGMNRQYRQVVEMLCRRGFLTIVIATGTLALGINVPCKTVVFSGDSVFLSALNFRQAAGRAGRRGFDLLGNVVLTQPQQRAFDVMSSKLPDLLGHFPLTTTLVLRLLSLCHHTKNGNFAADMTRSLLSQTRLYLGGPAGEMAVKHHLRFSIEYLRRQHLLSEKGAPLNFAGLLNHLYYTENASFAFHSLLKAGYFHKTCAAFHSQPEEVMREIMLVLCHLFGRIPCDRHGDRDWLEKVVEPSSSVVLLEPLPAAAYSAIRAHNEEALHIFQNYVRTFVRQHLDGKPDCELPFTRSRAGADSNSRGSSETGIGHLAASVFGSLPIAEIRSPFAALSGFTDQFDSIRELCATVRGGVFLEESAVPYIRLYPDDTHGVPWNAYLLDFFKHGSMEALVRANGIKRRDVWFRLKDFSLILATIVTSLANFLNPKAVLDADMINVQDVLDRAEEEKAACSEHDDDNGGGNINQGPGGGRARPLSDNRNKGKKKKVVADSWDDEQDDPVSDDSSRSGPPDDGYQAAFSRPDWIGDEDQSLVRVLITFQKIQETFDEKFKKCWA